MCCAAKAVNCERLVSNGCQGLLLLLLLPAAAFVSLPAGVCLSVLFSPPFPSLSFRPFFCVLFFASCACCFANNAEAAKLLIIVLYTLYFVMLDTHIVALPSLKALFTSEWENI